MQAARPIPGFKPAPYGSVFHWHEDRTVYTPAMLENWSNRELLIKHYHLTARLDGYNHLDAGPSAKSNCTTFREALRSRGIDGIQHCMQMDTMYDWGYREVQVFYPRVLTSTNPASTI